MNDDSKEDPEENPSSAGAHDPPRAAADAKEQTPASPPKIEPMPEDPSVALTFETLLKNPLQLLDAFVRGGSPAKLLRNLAFTSVGCLAIFGFILGTHATGTQLWAAPLKITLGTFAAGLICLPSLYIFSCLNGLDIKLSAAAGILFATICMIALLLLGFAPVLWIFSQSTESVVFMGGLALAFWAVAAFFGLGLISRVAAHLGAGRRGNLVVWMGIFVLVALQMSTSLRPIVGTSERLLPAEKKFFLTHWAEQMESQRVNLQATYVD